MTVCLFFGTFNPIHIGHLMMAEAVLDDAELGFTTIAFVPAGVPPHRQEERQMAPAYDRLQMVKLATAENPCFEVWPDELMREGPSYTVDTLRGRFPDLELRGESRIPMILGADALANLGTWHQAEVLLKACYFLQASRPNYPKVHEVRIGERSFPLETRLIGMNEIGVSSTEIRRRIGEGRSIRYQVHSKVREYILGNRLYSL